MSNVHYVNFCPWGILQSDFVQSKPFQVLGKAADNIPETVRATLASVLTGQPITPEEAWGSILFDCAVNRDMFISLIGGESIIIRADSSDEQDIIIPLSKVYKDAERIDEFLDQDSQVGLWDEAESALAEAAIGMMN